VLLQRLHQRNWYTSFDIRWRRGVLQQLPHHTRIDMQRCAAAVLTHEAAAAAGRAHGSAIRSYNVHCHPVRTQQIRAS
jgi:hypothetical protein